MDNRLWPLMMDGVENFLLINTALSIVIFIIVYSVRHSGILTEWRPEIQTRFYTAGIVIAPVISIWLVIGSLLPIIWLGFTRWRAEHQALHELHLLNAFTVSFDPVLTYVSLLFISGTAIVAIYISINAYFRINTVVRQLELGGEPVDTEIIEQIQDCCWQYGINVGLVVSRYPFSFVWGYFNSKLIISTGLVNALDREELAGLLAHEVAHHHRRDNLSKWILTICCYTSPAFFLSKLIYCWRSAQVEMICDEIAAQQTQSPMAVASALLKLKRLVGKLKVRTLEPMGSGFCGEKLESFENRINRLISINDELDEDNLPNDSVVSSLSRSWISSASIAIATFILSLAIMFMLSPLAIHRALETLLHI